MLSEEIQTRLNEQGIVASDETALREALEEKLETYTLFKLAPWPSRRWKAPTRHKAQAGGEQRKEMRQQRQLGA